MENRIIPTTWRENGVGLFGDLGPFSYQTYLLNGMEAEGFSAAGLRGGRQKGSKASAEDLAWVGRLDYTALPGFLAGGSVYYGDSGQDLDVDVSTTLVEGHVDWKRGGWELRALVVAAQLDNVEDLNAALAEDAETPIEDFASVGEELFGWYLQAGYDILSLLSPGEAALIPFVRYEQYNTQEAVPSGFTASGANDVEVITAGVSYKPITEVVIKADYQFYDNDAGTASDQWNLALGYVF